MAVVEREEDSMSESVRMFRSEPNGAITRLAQLDSRRPPTSAVLAAEVDGELRAALPLDGSPVIADPFRRTLEIVSLLELRAGQLQRQRPENRGRARFSAPLRAIRRAFHRAAGASPGRRVARRLYFGRDRLRLEEGPPTTSRGYNRFSAP